MGNTYEMNNTDLDSVTLKTWESLSEIIFEQTKTSIKRSVYLNVRVKRQESEATRLPEQLPPYTRTILPYFIMVKICMYNYVNV